MKTLDPEVRNRIALKIIQSLFSEQLFDQGFDEDNTVEDYRQEQDEARKVIETLQKMPDPELLSIFIESQEILDEEKDDIVAFIVGIFEGIIQDYEIRIEKMQPASKVPAKYPPISPGTVVRTTQENASILNTWAEEALLKRQWGVMGTVITHHDSHGLCYDIRHEDGSEGCYDPSELEVLQK